MPPPPAKVPKCILKTQWVIHSISKKKYMWYYFDISQSKLPPLDGSHTPRTLHQHIATRSPVFIISGTFHHHKNYTRNLRGQRQWGCRGHGHLWLHPRHVSNPDTTQETTSYIHYTNHSTRSPFLHTTQLQTKATPKLEFNSKTIAPKSTNLISTTLQPSATRPFAATLKRKAPSKSQNSQTNQKIIFTTFHVTFSLPHPHPKNHFSKGTCLHSLSPPHAP